MYMGTALNQLNYFNTQYLLQNYNTVLTTFYCYYFNCVYIKLL